MAWPEVDPASLSALAERLADGNLVQAQALLAVAGGGSVSTRTGLSNLYGDVFRWLIYFLAAITTGSALVVFALLRPDRSADEEFCEAIYSAVKFA